MTSEHPQIKVYVSLAQKKALGKAQSKSGLTVSEFRRLALKLICEQYEISWPDDMPQHGGKRNKQKKSTNEEK